MTRCEYTDCKRKVHPFLGECKHCMKKFCNKHYMIDLHQCEKLDDYILGRKEKLNKTIMNQKCQGSKIIHI